MLGDIFSNMKKAEEVVSLAEICLHVDNSNELSCNEFRPN